MVIVVNAKKKLIVLISIILSLLIFIFLFFLLKSDFKLTLNGKKNMVININSVYEEPNVDACYGNIFKCKKVDVRIKGVVNTNKEGNYKIEYIATYNKKSKKISRMVQVRDIEKPNLILEQNEFSICLNNKVKNYNVKATDNVDGDLTSQIKTEVKNDKLIFKVKDSAGNEQIKKVDYKKEDKEPPIITLNEGSLVYVKLNDKYVDKGFTTEDFCDGDLTSQTQVSGEVNTQKEGKYEIKYQVKDSSGNKTEVIKNVFVYADLITVNPPNKTIYLTFDDGPGEYTAELLDVLKNYNVKATFFVTNQYPAYENMITRAYNEGQAIGIHTYTHNYAYIYSSVENYLADLNNISQKVKKLTGGYESKLVRFPGGGSNTISKKYKIGIMSELAQELKIRGYKYFDWNVLSGDAGETKDTNQIINNVTSSLKNNYSIVLQHDVKSYSVKAVEEIIKFGKNNGYNFLPLDLTSPDYHHRINN